MKKENGIKDGKHRKGRIPNEFFELLGEIVLMNRKHGNENPITNTKIMRETAKYFKNNPEILKNEFVFIKK